MKPYLRLAPGVRALIRCLVFVAYYAAPLRHPVAIALALLAVLTASQARAQVAINRFSGDVHYISTKFSTNNVGGMYAAYQIQNNTGVAQEDVWVKADNFAGGVVGLGANEDGLVQLGAMAVSEAKMAYFFLTAATATTTPQTHTVTVYDASPDLPTASALGSANFTITEVATSISAAANKVDVVVHGPDPGTLGGVITMTVEGRTGTVGAGDILAFSAASNVGWPASTYRLFDSEITFLDIQGSNCGSTTLYTVADSLRIRWNQTSCYRAVYEFVALKASATSTEVNPIVHVSSGTQIKHTDPGNFGALSPIPPIDNKVTLGKSVSETTLPTGGTVTYTVTLTSTASNAGCPAENPTCNDATLRRFVDTLPTTPATPTYDANTSTYDASSITDPSIAANVLTWTGSFVVPAGGTATLTYDVIIPNTDGTYVNSIVGHIGGEQIDTTTDTSDDVPGTASTLVGSLPVELVAFDALADGRDVLLSWKTASETNNAGFEMHIRNPTRAPFDRAQGRLRAADASRPEIRNWEVLGFIDGQGTTETPRAYSYRVVDLAPGSYRFRLKQIDFDGTFEYSPEAEVSIGLAESFMVTPTYPNPFDLEARFHFAVQRTQSVGAALYDALGRQVRVLFEGDVPAGHVQEVRIGGHGLPSGPYFVRLAGATFRQSHTVMLLR